MNDKPKFPRNMALAVAETLLLDLTNFCERIVIAGSLRRIKPEVGDIEIVYIPRFEVRQDPSDMFASMRVNLVDIAIIEMERSGRLEKRTNINGSTMFGAKNKLMRHCETGIPVDLFAVLDEKVWFNYLVCRTGPARLNEQICMEAQRRGWKWHPYGSGFSRDGETRVMNSEEEVFAFVGLPFFPPEKRQ